LRIIHLSDIHIWRYALNPARLFSKRIVGMIELLRGRAGRFLLERIEDVVAQVRSRSPDHVLVTGDLTTTALRSEFHAAHSALAEVLVDGAHATVVPGNHDRYTHGSVRSRLFENTFREFVPDAAFPWLKPIGEETAVLGLDPTRPHLSARGFLPPEQWESARRLIEAPEGRPRRLIVACHYPLAAPPPYERELAVKKLKNDAEVCDLLADIGPHLYCCGHVHAAWAFTPSVLPNQLCLNAGAPLMRDPTGFRLPGFLEIELTGDGVEVFHHAWTGMDWMIVPLVQHPRFFAVEHAEAVSPTM
jgi:hypothetical protein